MRTTFWNGLPSSGLVCRSTASQSSTPYKVRSGHQSWTTIRRPLARVGMMPLIICSASSSSRHPAQLSPSCGGLKEGHREDGVGHVQDAWAALRKKLDGCSREALRAAQREIQTVKIWSDKDPDDFRNKKDRWRDRLNSVTPKEGPSDRQYEGIILQRLPPEYDRIRQTPFQREDCNLADIRRMMSKIYTDNLARSISDSSRGIAGRGATMQATGRDPSKIIFHYCNKFGHYKNECADIKAAHHQNRRRRQRKHKHRGGHQWDKPKPGGQHQLRGGGQMWCSYNKTTTDNGVDCRVRPANGLNGNVHFAQVRPPNVPGICSLWDLRVRDDSDEIPCKSFMAREVYHAASPPKLEWRRRGPSHPTQFRQQRRGGGKLAPGHLLRVLSRSSPLGDR